MATKKENAEVTATTNEAKPTRKVKLPRATGQYAPTQEFYSVNFKNYIVLRFPEGSVDAEKTLVSSDDKFRKGTKCRGKKAGIHIALKNKVTEIQLSTSYISFNQALLNLENEVSGKSLEEIKNSAESIWEEYISRVKIETKDEKTLKTFYSCMYRAFLYPHKCHEYDKNGNAIHYCPHDGSTRQGVRYTDNGFWDTYRTVYPFFALVAKDAVKAFEGEARGLLLDLKGVVELECTAESVKTGADVGGGCGNADGYHCASPTFLKT